MSDLIKREDALTAVGEAIFDGRSWYDALVYVPSAGPEQRWIPCSERLPSEECLPSAEPQIIPCKDCKHRVVNEHYGEKGYFKLKAYCDLDTGDIFELGRCAEDDDWFCADAERRTE